ncbi:hypothetical protein N8T08_011043 [Aspergillus melleus]|uniref:Uncharacterized protein n=1 Tax=Aspergillus melleus TaxID=138277 RepID=A0ACC3ARB1_9EURO|nr:hypothetical protein N8T08_011043 [Aspergillus melleus]
MGDPEDWHFWGIYDGHVGWATSVLLRRTLIPSVVRKIKKTLDEGMTGSSSNIYDAIQSAFIQMDNRISHEALEAMDMAMDLEGYTKIAFSRAAPARSGSCALLAVYDPNQCMLRIASVGDSRAVLGRRKGKNNRFALSLSTDHNGFNRSEYDRIMNEHPGETGVINQDSGRLFNMAMTRAFGDHRYKWSMDTLKRCYERFLWAPPLAEYLSPPYLTADPEITTMLVRDGDFLILASDGFWDNVSNDDAVQFVRHWILRYPSELLPTSDAEEERGLTRCYSFSSKDYVIEDDNVATHLARNALGGGNSGIFETLMSLRAPEAKLHRDDITIQVIFFGFHPEDERLE